MKLFYRTPKQIGYWNTFMCVFAPAGITMNAVNILHGMWWLAVVLGGVWSLTLYWCFASAHIKGGTDEIVARTKRIKDQMFARGYWN